MPQGYLLKGETQKTIMQIISTLRQIQTPDAASQLFRVLTETSASIESSNANLKDKPKEEEADAANLQPLD